MRPKPSPARRRARGRRRMPGRNACEAPSATASPAIAKDAGIRAAQTAAAPGLKAKDTFSMRGSMPKSQGRGSAGARRRSFSSASGPSRRAALGATPVVPRRAVGGGLAESPRTPLRADRPECVHACFNRVLARGYWTSAIRRQGAACRHGPRQWGPLSGWSKRPTSPAPARSARPWFAGGGASVKRHRACLARLDIDAKPKTCAALGGCAAGNP